jgi:putative transposase
MLVVGRRHLDMILREYVGHYNQHRPHRGLDLDVPLPSTRTVATPPPLRVRRRDVLGGLIHEYGAVAA